MSYKHENIPRIIVAIDRDNEENALNIINKLDPKLCNIKVGLELYVSCGPKIINKIHDLGFQIFLDLKFHDIKNTVSMAALAAAKLGVWMINIHSSCGLDTMNEVINVIKQNNYNTKVLGVTILTSLDDKEIKQIGFSNSVQEQVMLMASICEKANLHGVVCSANEVRNIKQKISKKLICVCPGIRSSNDIKDEQKRTITPEMAAKNGADYIVIGRPVTNSEDPMKSLKNIKEEFEKGL